MLSSPVTQYDAYYYLITLHPTPLAFLLLLGPDHGLRCGEKFRFDGVVLVVLLVHISGPHLRPSVLTHVIHCTDILNKVKLLSMIREF